MRHNFQELNLIIENTKQETNYAKISYPPDFDKENVLFKGTEKCVATVFGKLQEGLEAWERNCHYYGY